MPERTNEEVVRGYLAGMEAKDLDQVSALRHPDYVAEWPQSGERIRGRANMRAIDENYPGGLGELEPGHVVGTEDRWVVTPSYTVQKIVGGGDNWWADMKVTYGNGSTWFMLSLFELRAGSVFRETSYFCEPFDAPDWRAPWVERIG